jgi:threonine dehydrogenase-like Zn-dependent dehydrogenase
VRATVFYAPHDVRVEEVPDSTVQQPTDAVVRILLACICGSDLWPYNGGMPKPEGTRIGHEFLGVVDAVGDEVRSVSVGDLVLSPFTWSDGTCEYCQRGLTTSCRQGGFFGGVAGVDGGQGEAARVPQADGTLVRLPAELKDDADRLRAVLPLTDVLPTGHHAAVSGGVRAGSTVAVIGDGAVGLCAVLAASRLGAERIIALGHHDKRLELARRFGATDVVTGRGKEAVKAVRALTGGGVEVALECVGNQGALDTAVGAIRDGGSVGFVGVPAGVKGLDLGRIFHRNVGLRGGVAPVRAYLDKLLPDVLDGKIDPSPIFDLTVDLDHVPDGYVAMNERRALKVMVTP